ncbi:chromate ion transporter-like protein [Sistotremastrum niveocremeum HHB9708]|uniref:Chromate ion transporter-like protein n=1 Tax=Sistotremastrum niveocremeum HHB9708 TaxID=1314777 RepID=A0A164VM78_9AGAM|nr:chromate ion transporter-like protein [Sistotremastrum niveocremeum HHB9708]
MSSLFKLAIRKFSHQLNAYSPKLGDAIYDTLRYNWYLGFTSFGGPAVHFQIFHQRFVEKYAWVDEQMYKELFSLCQALPGPASTKMIYAVNLIRGGLWAGILSFFLWSLPGAFAAYGLAVGVSKLNDTLPALVYALLSGLNAATVGIIALAAVQLSEKAISDKLTRTLVFLGGCAGMLYNALWYFPVLMALGGVATILWDYRWLQDAWRAVRNTLCGLRTQSNIGGEEREISDQMTSAVVSGNETRSSGDNSPPERVVPADLELRTFSWKFGVYVISGLSLAFIVLMTLRGTLHSPPRGFSLFANLFLAGTIIFGGGPVVIPLLREYVVSEGWVSPRDFLLGLAICQAFPGPNFNFAVYLGTLAVSGHMSLAAGAITGFLGIFAPGIILFTGTMGVWKALRNHRWFTSALRGVNAAAVGLIYTAVYRLWEQGFLSSTFTSGSSLGLEPWWLVVAATSFVGGRWFNLPAPVAIVMGGVMGMIWYGIVTA